ncbi:CHAT domain-containing protein [Paraliomyxa miuraensis]|uniref:CHAT domain-containing protein n=1 Tax=Paraliomyxa miuraensis TaxID=376150 RepID=UPI002253ABE4|nr:CHAT domain-containing protein [Paraliomyxa miuraensis]MCX4239190.1 CHAT domain-containing protein [Paraliomyxa miuraensis]
MKRATLALQVALAVAIVTACLLWVRWSPECNDDDAACDAHVVARLEVEYGGCMMIVGLAGDEVECIYGPDAELRVWVTHPRIDEVTLSVDGEPWAYTTADVPEETLGQGFRGRIASDTARRLQIGVPGQPTRELRLRSSKHITPVERLVLSQLDERAIWLQSHLLLGHLEVLPEVEAMMDRLLSAGMLSLAVDEGLAASVHLSRRSGRLDLAEQVLARVEASAKRYPEGSASWGIYHAHLLEQRGRLVEAAVGYRQGAHHALRMDDAAMKLDVLSDYSMVLAELGYFEAALYWGQRALVVAQQAGRPADRVAVKRTVARMSVRLREARRTADSPEQLLREILLPSPPGSTPRDPGEIEPARLTAAKLMLLEKDLGRTQRLLDELDTSRLTPEQRVEAQDVRLQLLLINKAPASKLHMALAELETLASSSASPGPPWLVAVRRGEVLEQEEDLAGAKRAYEESEDLLDGLVPLALLGAQGELAPAHRREGTERLVSLLLRQHQPDEALCVLRRSQARMGLLARLFMRLSAEEQAQLRPRVAAYLQVKRELEALVRSTNASALDDERDAALREAERLRAELDQVAVEILSIHGGYEGRPSCESLSPRLPGELLLGLYPHRDSLLVLVQDDERTTYRELSDPEALTSTNDSSWLGAVLLDSLDARLFAAKRVRVLAAGKGAAIPVHALPWRERLLIEHMPVVYGLDLPPHAPRGTIPRSPSALVIADASAKSTGRETEEVESLLGEAGWDVTRRRSSKLTGDDLQRELARVDHFHYAGHADFDEDPEHALIWPPYPGGAAAEPSYIPLGGTERLSVQDILMMQRVPPTVVLMGCKTGVYDDRVAYGGLSLATAFLGAGAEAVVASTREINGTEGALVGQGLYAELGRQGIGEPGAWFMQAMEWSLAHGLDERAVQDYRVLVP